MSERSTSELRPAPSETPCYGINLNSSFFHTEGVVFNHFRCQDVVTAFKQLLPMISVTEVVNKQNQCKFHLRLGQPIKQMLINGGKTFVFFLDLAELWNKLDR